MSITQSYRPNIGEAHEVLVNQLTGRFNNGALSSFRDIDIVRRAIEELWKKAHPGQELPAEVKRLHKNYYADLDF